MATGSAQDEQGLPKDEVRQLRSEFQLVGEHGQASMMLAMRDMMAEFMRNKGRSESSSAGSSAAGRERPRGAEPSAVRTSVAAGGLAGDTAAGREITLRGEASRNLGATGRREAAVPVEVGPARGQPDQPRRAGEWDAFPRGLARCGAGTAAAATAAGSLTRRGAAAAAATAAAGPSSLSLIHI